MKEIEQFIDKFHLEKLGEYNALKAIPDNSIDCIVTDPPYGYSYMGKDWDKAVPSVEVWRECLRVLKDGAFMFVMSAPRQDCLSQMIVRLEQAGFNIGFSSIYWCYSSGFPKALNIGKKTKVKKLEGSFAGFNPKPAVEVIIVCMKPLSEKTYVEQALKNGKGVTWLNKCRIPTSENLNGGAYAKNSDGRNEGDWREKSGFKEGGAGKFKQPEGRFPANLLVSDNALDDGTITKSGVSKKVHEGYEGESNTKFLRGVSSPNNQHGDVGGFSRYFDLDKWWEEKIKQLPDNVQKTYPFLICPKASKSERNKGCEELDEKQVNDGRNKLPDNAFQRGKTFRKNTHPTVKPIKLMSYLITLGSREGDIILDPYVGSGSTCIAAQIINRKWIGIDAYKEYLEIASARLNGAEIVDWDKDKSVQNIDNKITNWAEQYENDMKDEFVKAEQPQSLIETKKEAIIGDMCPICGSKMVKIKENYYCTKASCDGKVR